MHTILGALSFALLASTPPEAREDSSPYFLVKGDPSVDRLPLERTAATVEVSGVIAHVELRQTYTNEGTRPIEAVYVFPISTRGAVFGMRMRLGDRVIRAEIRERKEARKDYDEAKEKGQTASLLEEQRPNVLQMNVANILPGDRIEVEVDYVETLSLNSGEYELVLPTVVGPRYTQGSKEPAPSDRSRTPPQTATGVAPSYKLAVSAHIAAGVPIAAVESSSHRIVTIMSPDGDPSHADILLDEPEGGNRDFILRYRLSGDAPQSGLLLSPGGDEQFFLAMLQPPARLEPSAIPPRELVFIIDVSCSMGGFPMDTTKAFVNASLSGLRPMDRFNLMFFSGGDTLLASESIPATPPNLQRARRMLSAQSASGGTEIRPAIEKALRMPRTADVSTSFVVVTDGFVSVERETFALIRKNLGVANLFSFGIGRSVNRHLIEGIARAGMGEPFVVEKEKDATQAAAKLGKLLESPSLTRVKVDFDGFDAYDVVPESIPDLFVDRPVVVFGKFRGAPKGHIRIEGYNAAGRYSAATSVETALAGSQSNSALRLLWARHAIQTLEDEDAVGRRDEGEKRIRTLGLRYGLLTQHTSFVAIDSAVRNGTRDLQVIEQPLPTPEGTLSMNGSIGSVGYGAGGGGIAYGAGGLGLRGASGKAGRVTSPPRVRQGAAIVLGSVDRKTILKSLQPALRRVRVEYQKVLIAQPALNGKVLVQLTVESDGKVSQAVLTSSTLGHPALEAKILEAFKRLQFPKGHGVVVINYPMILRAEE